MTVALSLAIPSMGFTHTRLIARYAFTDKMEPVIMPPGVPFSDS